MYASAAPGSTEAGPRLGCPGWAERAWLGTLYPPGARQADWLAHYAQVMDCVEGNTTFYATPSPATVARWAAQTPAHFHFVFKLPQAITHQHGLRGVGQEVTDFLRLMSPLGERMGPLLVQLPSRFGPADLPALEGFLPSLPQGVRAAVEVRHPAFFQRGDDERRLVALLREQGAERVSFDSRALFSAPATDESLREAQARKPRLPVHAMAITDTPMVRFIGHPVLADNLPFLSAWEASLQRWRNEGKRPYFFCHMADNRHAPALVNTVRAWLGKASPGVVAAAPQTDLFA